MCWVWRPGMNTPITAHTIEMPAIHKKPTAQTARL